MFKRLSKNSSGLISWVAMALASALAVGHARAARADDASAAASDDNEGEVGALGIGNFSEVSPGIFRGARPPLAAVAQLPRIRIRTVINIQGGDGDLPYGAGRLLTWFEPGERDEAIEAERDAAESHGVKFYNFPLPSVKMMNASEDQAVDQVLRLMHDASAGGVFLHCEHGNDRTGMIVALYRVCYENVSPSDAHDEMVRKGHRMINRTTTWPMDRYFWKKARAACGPIQGRLDPG